jgi:hypothetical protein
MGKLRAVWIRLLGLGRRGGSEQDFREELETHLALAASVDPMQALRME